MENTEKKNHSEKGNRKNNNDLFLNFVLKSSRRQRSSSGSEPWVVGLVGRGDKMATLRWWSEVHVKNRWARAGRTADSGDLRYYLMVVSGRLNWTESGQVTGTDVTDGLECSFGQGRSGAPVRSMQVGAGLGDAARPRWWWLSVVRRSTWCRSLHPHYQMNTERYLP